MAGSRRITIEFLGKDVTAGKVANQVEGKYSKLGGSMGRTGAIAGRALAGGLLIAGAAAVKAGNAAVEDEAAQSKLANTLHNAAGASDSQVASTERWITAQGLALGVTDDELRPALGKLAVATKDVGEAQRLASLAMDVSAGSGKSLEQVTTALQKGVNGSVGGLSRLGVATKNADGSTKSLDQITKELAKTYNGAAAKAADTTAGKQRKLKVQFGELQEEIGAKLIPVMGDLADKALAAIGWMTKHQKLAKVLAVGFAGTAAALWATSKAMAAFTVVSKVCTAAMALGNKVALGTRIQLAALAVQEKVLAAASKAWAVAQWLLNTALSANPIGIVVIAIAALVAGLIYAYKNSETFRRIVKGAFDGVAAAAKFMWEGVIKPVFRFITSAWLAVAGAIINGAAHAFGWVPGLGPKLRKAADWFNDFKKQVNAQLDGTHDKKKITISTPGADTAISNLATIRRLMHDISSSKPMKAPKKGGIGVLLGANARGTSNWHGGLTSIHEQGGEIVDLPGRTRIYPAGLSRTMARTGGGGGDVTVSAPLVLQLDSKVVWQGMLKMKRQNGGVSLGLA